jgi:hypothetical protein
VDQHQRRGGALQGSVRGARARALLTAHAGSIEALVGAAPVPLALEGFRERRAAHRGSERWLIVYVEDGGMRGRRILRGRVPGWRVRGWLRGPCRGALALLEAVGRGASG